MGIMDDYYKHMVETEIRLAQRNPVFEAEYLMRDDPKAPLRLYDCLVPHLKMFHKSRPLYEESHQYIRSLIVGEENRSLVVINR